MAAAVAASSPEWNGHNVLVAKKNSGTHSKQASKSEKIRYFNLCSSLCLHIFPSSI